MAETQILRSCEGEDERGARGERGPRGERGERGERGPHGERGERGHRGHRGHQGHDGLDGRDGRDGRDGLAGATGATGPIGATGATGPMAPSFGGLLKFSGVVAPSGDGPVVSYLTDFGVGRGAAGVLSEAPSYPFAVAHDVRNLAVRVITPLVGSPGGAILFELLQNGTVVPGFNIVFLVGGSIGNQVVIAGPAPFSEGSRLDLRATAAGITNFVDASATLGIE